MLQWSTEPISTVNAFLDGSDCEARDVLVDFDSLRAFDDEPLGCASLISDYLAVSYDTS